VFLPGEKFLTVRSTIALVDRTVKNPALEAAPFLDDPCADLRLGHLGELFGERGERASRTL
jgi:hypothetical protein